MNTQTIKPMVERALAAVIVTASLLTVWTVVRPARDRAGEVCLSNLRRLGIASRMYSDDFDGRLVPYANTNTHARCTGILRPYLQDDSVFRCPSDHLNRTTSLDSSLSTTYGVNWYLCGTVGAYGNTVLTSSRSSSLREPARTVWAADTAVINAVTANLPASGWKEDVQKARVADFYYFYLPNNPTTGAAESSGWSSPNFTGYIVRPFPRHRGMVNCAFFDGHAAAVPGSQFDPAHNPDAAWGKPGCIWDNPS